MNDTQILNRYAKAVNALREAEKALREIGADWRNYTSDEAKYYASQIAELISCDHGESGLESMVKFMEKRTGSGLHAYNSRGQRVKVTVPTDS